MASMISRLYHDELRLSERDYPEDSRAFILLDSFKEDVEWLKKMLDGKAKEHLLELISIHDELGGKKPPRSASRPVAPLLAICDLVRGLAG